MGWFKNTKADIQASRDVELLIEEKLYEYVQREMENDDIRPGLWTKANATINTSDIDAVNRKYIQLRVEMLRAEGRLFNRFLEEVTDEMEEEEERQPKKKSFFDGCGTLILLSVIGYIIFLFLTYNQTG